MCVVPLVAGLDQHLPPAVSQQCPHVPGLLHSGGQSFPTIVRVGGDGRRERQGERRGEGENRRGGIERERERLKGERKGKRRGRERRGGGGERGRGKRDRGGMRGRNKWKRERGGKRGWRREGEGVGSDERSPREHIG